jgi:low affinity Fe/Cu permease
MKTIIGVIILVVVMSIVVQHRDTLVPEYKYEKELTSEVSTQEEVEVIEEDTIEKARQELERINAELDAKETELLQERDAIDAELERLRETRVSFQ